MSIFSVIIDFVLPVKYDQPSMLGQYRSSMSVLLGLSRSRSPVPRINHRLFNKTFSLPHLFAEMQVTQRPGKGTGYSANRDNHGRKGAERMRERERRMVDGRESEKEGW